MYKKSKGTCGTIILFIKIVLFGDVLVAVAIAAVVCP